MGGLAATGKLLEMVQVDGSTMLLDVGCGTGYTACSMAKKHGCRVVGIDYSEEMIAKAERRALRLKLEDKVEFHVANVSALPFDDGTFDVAIFESFLNVLVGDKRKALEEIARVVKRGGRVGGNEVFRAESTPPEILERIRELLEGPFGPGQNLDQNTPKEWVKLFDDADLQVVEVIEKPSTRSPISPKDFYKAMGFFDFVKFTFRATYDILTLSDLRRVSKRSYPVRKMMHREGETRIYFGYLLIVGQKS